jgi:hypothetical protein
LYSGVTQFLVICITELCDGTNQTAVKYCFVYPARHIVTLDVEPLSETLAGENCTAVCRIENRIGQAAMKRAAMGLAVLLLSLPANSQDKQLVLLAAHRLGRVEVLDPTTLAPIGSINALPLADGISTSPDGNILYLPEGLAPDFKGCCALYALNLETRRMTRLVAPSRAATVSPDGSHVLTQRGNVGIEVYDGRTFDREPSIPHTVAPGVYRLSFSPDGLLLFGTTNGPQASLDIFDFASQHLVRRYSIAGNVAVLGTWLQGDFDLYAYDDAQGQLWKVNPLDRTLGEPLKTRLPNPAPECAIYDEEMVGAGNRILLYEGFGGKLDRRPNCRRSVPGGVFSVDPETGNIGRRLAGGLHFASLVPSPDGKELFGIDLRHSNWDAVRLVRIDVETGSVLVKKELMPDVWFIDLAQISRRLVPHGQLETVHE